jgi:hypothetical protein
MKEERLKQILFQIVNMPKQFIDQHLSRDKLKVYLNLLKFTCNQAKDDFDVLYHLIWKDNNFYNITLE